MKDGLGSRLTEDVWLRRLPKVKDADMILELVTGKPRICIALEEKCLTNTSAPQTILVAFQSRCDHHGGERMSAQTAI